LKKILIVSGTQTFKKKDILNRAEYKIFTAMSGEEALKMHESQKMDLIIADLDTYGISGDKLCSLVKKEKKMKRTFIILACPDNKLDIERSKKSGADFYITKPVNADQLLKKIGQVFNVQRRESLRVPIEVSVVGSYFYTTFFCHAVDISSTGLLIETDMILKKGKIVSCLLSLPDSRQITVHGKIMRVTIKSNDIYRYGISFYDLKTDTRSAIEAFVGKQTSMK